MRKSLGTLLKPEGAVRRQAQGEDCLSEKTASFAALSEFRRPAGGGFRKGERREP